MTLTSTNNIERIIYERTSQYESESQNPMFLAKRVLSIDTNPIPVQDVIWNIKFRLAITYKDGSHEFSNVYSINDYIDEEDLKLLQESSAVVNIEDTHSEITVDNGRIIHCSTSGKGRISIFKLNGECIYTEEIQALKSIDLEQLKKSNNSILIISLQTNDKNITKKFLNFH